VKNLIPCPQCENPLALYNRTDKNGYLHSFLVECDKCGFVKVLRRPMTMYKSWKIGYRKGYEDAQLYYSCENIFIGILGVTLVGAVLLLIQSMIYAGAFPW
jgi:hypothetical protein